MTDPCTTITDTTESATLQDTSAPPTPTSPTSTTDNPAPVLDPAAMYAQPYVTTDSSARSTPTNNVTENAPGAEDPAALLRERVDALKKKIASKRTTLQSLHDAATQLASTTAMLLSMPADPNDPAAHLGSTDTITAFIVLRQFAFTTEEQVVHRGQLSAKQWSDRIHEMLRDEQKITAVCDAEGRWRRL